MDDVEEGIPQRQRALTHHTHALAYNTNRTDVVKMYERMLKSMNPNVNHITYDIKHLLQYVDEMTDISALV